MKQTIAMGMLLAAASAMAHPLGQSAVSQYSGLTTLPDRLELHYALDLAELASEPEVLALDADRDGSFSQEEFAAYLERKSTDLLGYLDIRINDQASTWSLVTNSVRILDGDRGKAMIRLDIKARTALPSSKGPQIAVAYRDRNYEGQSGLREIVVVPGPGTHLLNSTVSTQSVSRVLTHYPPEQLSQPINNTKASFSFAVDVVEVAEVATAQPGNWRTLAWVGLAVIGLLLVLALTRGRAGRSS
jgi:hypothetical protein